MQLPRRHRPALTLALAASIGAAPATAIAESQSSVATLESTAIPPASEQLALQVRKTDAVDWVALPIPISNPTVGTGLALAAMALYHVHGAKAPSNTAVGVFKTDNESQGGGVLQQTYLGNSRWQVNAAVVKADLNLKFYGIGKEQGDVDAALPIDQDVEGGAVWVMTRIAPGLSIGPRYRFDSVIVQPDVSQEQIDSFPIPLPPLEIDLDEATLELLAEYDTRNSRFGPSEGWYVQLSAGFTDKAFGSDITYQRHTLAVNWYYKPTGAMVMALRGSLCDSSQDAPFFAMCQFGQTSDLRGYVIGQYRDRSMAAVQGEVRWHAWKRLGAVAFAGVGNVADKIGNLSFSDALSSWGLGARFLASPENNVNVGIDIAYADGESAVYFRIGEAF